MRLTRLLLLLALAFITFSCQKPASSDDTSTANNNKNEPATKFEKFVSRKGSVIIKDFYEIGTLEGDYLTRATLTAIVVSEPGKTDKVYALKFERPATSEYGIDQTGVIDFDELVSLQDALDYMAKTAAQLKTESRPYTEVVFQTRGGLQAGFYQKVNEQKGFVQLNNYGKDNLVAFPVEKISAFRDLVSEARSKLASQGAK